MSANLLAVPQRAQRARFAPSFGRRVLLTVDTEEEFDWTAPFRADGYGMSHVAQIGGFQEFCEDLGVAPVYLLTWPMAVSPQLRDILAAPVARGRAEIGIQLHPWVNPPFEEEITAATSYAGNLPPDLERRKFAVLHAAIGENFGVSPAIYRAGRYGLGSATAAMLQEAGIAIDSSVRRLFDYRPGGGPDYRLHPGWPYWSGARGGLLELPLTTVHWGMLRRQGRWLHPLVAAAPPIIGGLMARVGLLERIALTPEGVTKDEAIRGIDIALDDGLPLLVLSFHSPSLAPGHTPYVRDRRDVAVLYDWIESIYAYCDQRGVRPTTIGEIRAGLER